MIRVFRWLEAIPCKGAFSRSQASASAWTNPIEARQGRRKGLSNY